MNDTTKYLFRVIRELIVRKQEDAKKIYMHATGLIFKNKGIVMLGNKGSGKTTFFSKILEKNVADILSNDRVFFYQNDGHIYMDYFPIPVVCRIGTVINNKQLKKYIIEETHYQFDQRFICGESSLPIPLTDFKYIFKRCTLRERHSVDFLVFTKFHLEWDKKFVCKKLESYEIVKLLKEVCFTPTDYESERVEWIYFRRLTTEALNENVDYLIKAISNNVSAFWVEYGKEVDINKVLEQVV